MDRHPRRPHHHGYTWLGSGFELHRDGLRRDVHPGFRDSPLPPLEVAHWLLKPASWVSGTWDEARPALEWYAGQLAAHLEEFASEWERVAAPARLGAARERLAAGDDVVGGWWLSGRRFLSVSLVACSPHRTRPEFRCPVPAVGRSPERPLPTVGRSPEPGPPERPRPGDRPSPEPGPSGSG
ncbi:hypothetical protein JNUCC64_21725 [Streptomyces sp. JNUCC 64]